MQRAQTHRGTTSRRVRLAARALTLACSATLALAGVALANAPDPGNGTQALVGPVYTVNGVDVARVSLSGPWQWPTHSSDCNTNRNGVGYAVAWNDPDQPGNHVTTLTLEGSIDVGGAADGLYNPLDNEVHPTRPEADGTLFNDPGDPALYDSWHSGCGTYDGNHPNGVWGAVDLASGDPILCTDANTPSPACLGGSHVYTVAALDAGIQACVLLYDVHGDRSDSGGTPSGDKEITAGGKDHNTDNGAEDNASPLFDRACVTISASDPSATPDPGTPQPGATPDPSATPTPDPSGSPDPSASPDPSGTPDPSATPDSSASPDPSATVDPNGTPDPTDTPDPSATPDPNATPTPTPDDSPLPDTAMLGGPSDSGPGVGGPIAALAGGLIALAGGTIVATRRSRRLVARPTATTPTGPWSTNPLDGPRR